MSAPNTLVARLDNVGDVLLAGPALRAVAAGSRSVTLLAGPSGAAVGGLLPGVDEVLTWTAPWVPDPAPPVDVDAVGRLVELVAARAFDQALVLTSFHQSPLPLALLLRLAGVPRIAATSVDYPGSLLDVRVAYDPGLHEVEQQLAVAAGLGHHLPPGDDGALAIDLRPEGSGSLPTTGPGGYVVVHPGASVPARALPPELAANTAAALAAAGRTVVVTGSAADRPLAAAMVAAGGDAIVDRVGSTGLGDLARLIAGADAIVVGNTGPAHLAAAVGTPVVEVFAPTVDPRRWAPWRVPHRLLGATSIACAGCRARRCPVPGQPCVGHVRPDDVVAAVDALVAPAVRPFAEVAR